MDYQLVNKVDIPPRAFRKTNKLVAIVVPLSKDKAIKMVVGSLAEAQLLQNDFLAALRFERRRKSNFHFHIKTRTIELENGEATLYIWKEDDLTNPPCRGIVNK